MKVKVNNDLWKQMNIFSRIFLVIGMFFTDLSMKLAGLTDGETELEQEL